MKKAFVVLAAILSAALSAHALTVSKDCYQISSADDLYEFAALFATNRSDTLASRLKCAELTQDIVVNENVLKADGSPNKGSFRPWKPIDHFSGSFDGQNHTVSGLYQVEPVNNDVGLFSYVKGTVKNLGIVDSYFHVPDTIYRGRVGSLVAYLIDTLTIENCYSAATMEATLEIGGIAGLVGITASSAVLTIKDSYNKGIIESSYEDEEDIGVGGLVGRVAPSSEIFLVNSYNMGNISGYENVGGLIGSVESADSDESSAQVVVERCFNSGRISGLGSAVGGLMGYGHGVIKESNNVGSIEASSAVGGLVGRAYLDGIAALYNRDSLRIENSYNRGRVERILPEGSTWDKSEPHVGAFVGEVERVVPFIVNSYNVADIVLDGNVGNWLIGENWYSNKPIIKNTINKKGSDVEPYEGVVDVEDSLFFNGVVATFLHENNEVWGQEFVGEGMFPDLTGKVNASVGVYPITWHTIEGDTNVYPSTYTEGIGLKLPEKFERKGFIFEGWYAVASPTDKDKKIEKIGEAETGAKTLYAVWTKLVDFDGKCYLISDAQELYNFASIVNGYDEVKGEKNACGKLMKDIVVNENVLNSNGNLNKQGTLKKWTPINRFEGVFDGNGHTIYGLYYNDINTEEDIGFFGEIDLGREADANVEIKNLGLEDFYFRGKNNVGAFVAYANSSNKDLSLIITNSHSNGVVVGNENVGGFVGSVNMGAEMLDCYNMSFVNARKNAGGFVGEATSESIIWNSYNIGPVNAEECVGGFIGYISNTSVDITNSYNSGAISGFSDIGGLVGYIYHYKTLSILRSYNAGEVRGITDVGGLVGTGYGYPDIVFINSYNNGRVIGSTNVAGLLGWMKSVAGSVSVFNSYNAGEIVSDEITDGEMMASLVGYCEGGRYSFDNAFYLSLPNMEAINLYTPEDESDLFDPVVYMDNFISVTVGQLMGGAVADSLRNWYEKDDGKPKENGQDGFAWAEDLAGTKILPHLNLDNTKHRVMLVAGEDGKVAKDHEVTYYEEGVPVNLPDSQYVSREGYFFVDWYDNSYYSGSPVTSVDVSGSEMKVYYAKWKMDSTLISSSSEEGSSSSKSSSSVASSSSAKSSSSVSSSSSAKSSSSSTKSSSSSTNSDKSSSSGKKDSFERVVVPQFSVNVVNCDLQVAHAHVGDRYALFDMQGNVVLRGTVNSSNFNVSVPIPGNYVLRIGNGSRRVTVRF
ncbi:MAG: InlB B-repeat-containing protein [Fibrobacter sp.]|nr:InlB B-repeat-containing protein [Fibrobacter sp.]